VCSGCRSKGIFGKTAYVIYGATMDFILGVLGVMQITFIPGLVCYKSFKFRANLFDKVLIIFGTSLILNYCGVLLFSILHIYTRITLVVLLLGEIVAILWLYRNDLKTPVNSLLNAAQDGVNEIADFFFPMRPKDDVSNLYCFLTILLLLLSGRGVIWVVSILFQNLGTVFSSWDAVVSWNQWATIWATGQIPMGSHFYPQLIPANWSITYVLLGSTTIQFFAKGIMPVFALMMLIGLLNLAIQTKEYHFLISLILLQSLLKKFIDSGVYNGYVDIAVAFFTFAAIYILIKTHEIPEIEQRRQLYILGTFFSAGAAITKQTGVFIALAYPVLIYLDMFPANSKWERKQLRMFILSFAAISVIWISWYIFKEFQVLAGTDRANIDTLISLSANRYNGMNLFQQIAAAIGQFNEFVVLFILIGLAFPWMNRFYKTLTLLFAPYPLLWAWMAAYDTRNLAIFLPLLALVSGYAINRLLLKLVKLIERTKILQVPVYVPVILICVALFCLNFIISPQKLHQRQETLQKQIFSSTKNQMLYDLIAENGPETRILTNYPMQYLPGLGAYQVRFNFQDYDIFLANVQNPQIEYILLPNSVEQRIKDYINSKIDSGDYTVILRDKEWKVFTLIKIVNRE